VALEEGLDAGALMAAAATVNQAHFAQARGVRGNEILVDQRRDIRRREAVEIEHRFDREPDRFRLVVDRLRLVVPIVLIHRAVSR
jgi:hypothetical protein